MSYGPWISNYGNIYNPILKNYVTYQLPDGNYYFNFSWSIIYPAPGTYTFTNMIKTYTIFGWTYFVYNVTVIVGSSLPLNVVLFASRTIIEAGQTVYFKATVQNGNPPYGCKFTPTGGYPYYYFQLLTPINNQALYFTDYINYWTYNYPGVYHATLKVYSSGPTYYVLSYQVTIYVLPHLNAYIYRTPSGTPLEAPVSIAFNSVVTGGQMPYSYQWYINSVPFNTASGFVNTFSQSGWYEVYLYVWDQTGSTAYSNYLYFEVTEPTTIIQVVSARVQATLSDIDTGGPMYYAYSGPAMWGSDGSLNATFMMPNVPALNAQYYLNVSYGYTVAITKFVLIPIYIEGEPYPWLSTGSWQTYFYNVYSVQPYGTTILTVVAGGQIISSNELQNGITELQLSINGVDKTISTSTLSLMNALSSGFKTVNDGIVTIQTQGSEIQTTLTAINATMKSVDGGIATINTSIGTIQTSLTSINAGLKSLDGNMATINTSFGSIQTSLSSINATVTSSASNINDLVGSSVTIKTSLGDVKGTVTSIDNNVATIDTKLGTIKTNVDDIHTTTGATHIALSSAFAWWLAVLILVIITLALLGYTIGQVRRLTHKETKETEETEPATIINSSENTRKIL